MANLNGKKGNCKRGFFVQRSCNKSAVAKCPVTQKYICEDCAVEYEGKTISREAYVALMKKQGKSQNIQQEISRWQTGEQRHYGLWYYYLREDFYESQNYEPFTDFDASAFEDGGEFGGGEFGGAGASGGWDEEGGKADFFDS